MNFRVIPNVFYANAKEPQSRMVAGGCGFFHVLMGSVVFGEMVPTFPESP